MLLKTFIRKYCISTEYRQPEEKTFPEVAFIGKLTSLSEGKIFINNNDLIYGIYFKNRIFEINTIYNALNNFNNSNTYNYMFLIFYIDEYSIYIQIKTSEDFPLYFGENGGIPLATLNLSDFNNIEINLKNIMMQNIGEFASEKPIRSIEITDKLTSIKSIEDAIEEVNRFL